ncbi:hypothetical protein D1872_312040 [compost metagenome]
MAEQQVHVRFVTRNPKLHDGEQQLLLVFEMIINVGLRYAAGLYDFIHADIAVSLAQKQL